MAFSLIAIQISHPDPEGQAQGSTWATDLPSAIRYVIVVDQPQAVHVDAND